MVFDSYVRTGKWGCERSRRRGTGEQAIVNLEHRRKDFLQDFIRYSVRHLGETSLEFDHVHMAVRFNDADFSDLTLQKVPLRKGPPTKDELLVYYPAKYTWEQLKTIINSGYGQFDELMLYLTLDPRL